MSVVSKLTAIADAIRAKTGGTTEMTLDQMATAISGIQTGGGGLTVATGSSTPESGQTIGTIETGLSSIAYLVFYKGSISATGLVQAVYVASEGNTYMVYCSSYSTYMKSFATGTSTEGTTNGGTFNWGVTNTNTQGMRGGTYNWIAFGAA